MASSVGKRLRERQKQERARAKAERKAARVSDETEADAGEADETVSDASESELIEQLGELHRAFEAGDVAEADFEERRDALRSQLERFSR